MTLAPELPLVAHPQTFELEKTGTQWLPVNGYVPVRFLATYRCEASRLRSLVPAPFTLDTFEGFGFVSVCALEVRGMGIVGLPRAFRFDNREFLYRLAIRFRGEPTFLTLRSDVSAPPLAWLGRRFSHYRPHLGTFSFADREGRVRIACSTPSGVGDATFDAAHEDAPRASASVFSSAEHAADFLLGMSFSADATPEGRVRVQPIEHDPWKARLVRVHEARFAFLDRLAAELGCTFEYDSTLATHGIRQTWKAARWT
jgi:hypothetical protein